MIEDVKVAVVGVGNNTSALVQGIAFYRNTGSLVGVHRPEIVGLGVGDIKFVAAFARSDGKVGKDLHEAILMPPNNFPRNLPHLKSQKIAHLNIEAQGWGETAVSLDVRLKVHDLSGAAGVNIDLIRIAATALRSGRGGYPAEAASLLKSPPGAAI